jgi:Fe-S-cluster-containing hydrogenase component 2
MTDSSCKRLIIDLEKCDGCESCVVDCGYYNRPHAHENGLWGLRQKATFALICRRCAVASCIEACAFDALERGGDMVLERHNMRCVSCKMCAHACPFGTIYEDMLAFYEVNCEACLAGRNEAPVCVASCPHGALEYRDTDPSEEGVHIVDENLAARAEAWVRMEATS